MQLDIISYQQLCTSTSQKQLAAALLHKGIVGIRDVPNFLALSRNYIHAARAFSALDESAKQQYAPARDAGETEGYELGAEKFKDTYGNWIIDDKKASFYAYVPDHIKNKWPQEIDLKTPYLKLGELIFAVCKQILSAIGVNKSVGIAHQQLSGYGRLLHYQKHGNTTDANPIWCGAHHDHGVFTGLLPAYYFRDGIEIDEPHDAGLYIMPTGKTAFEKIDAADKSILLFQVGEFSQLATHDRIRATKHMVKKANGSIERFTFALFINGNDDTIIQSQSELANDARYTENQSTDGRINYTTWSDASFARYHAK